MKIQESATINPVTVCYVEQPGHQCGKRDLNAVRQACEQRGFQVFDNKDGAGVIGARVEMFVTDYWDENGRVCRTEFTGDRGAIGTDGITNLYEFDRKGRLVRMAQMLHKKGTRESAKPKERIGQLFREHRYEYFEDRPDEEYTEYYTGTDGKTQTLTEAERKDVSARNE